MVGRSGHGRANNETAKIASCFIINDTTHTLGRAGQSGNAQATAHAGKIHGAKLMFFPATELAS